MSKYLMGGLGAGRQNQKPTEEKRVDGHSTHPVSSFLEVIGEADQQMLCTVDAFKASSSDKGLIKPKCGPCIFVFGKDSDIWSDEGTKACERIPSAGGTGITLYFVGR